MHKKCTIVIGTISTFFSGSSIAFAQTLPAPDLSVWNSSQMQPIHNFANIAVGVIFGVAVLYSVVMIAWYGIKLQGSGSDLIKSQEAKNGLKATLFGITITFCAIFVISIILYVLGVIGIKTS